MYERLIERAIGGQDRDHYTEAGAFFKLIRAVRRVQWREVDFERYYQGLLATYCHFSVLKDELRKTVEGRAHLGYTLQILTSRLAVRGRSFLL